MKAAFLAVIVVVLGLQGSSVNAAFPVSDTATQLLDTVMATATVAIQNLLIDKLPKLPCKVVIVVPYPGESVKVRAWRPDITIEAKVTVHLTAELRLIECDLWVRATRDCKKILEAKLHCPKPVGILAYEAV